MSKLTLVCTVACFFLALSIVPAHGESRGKPLTEEQLFERSTLVFIGEVLQLKTFELHRRSVPVSARVLLSLKGKVELGERDMIPKDPGRSVYFDEEFSPAAKGDKGVFYVGKDGQMEQLIGFRRFQ